MTSRSTVPQSPYQRDQNGVWSRADQTPSFPYTDGDAIEQNVAEIIAATADRRIGSESLMAHISDWATLYHLSSARANLLRPIAHRLAGKRVLEIGAGCGAITRYLGELGADVVAIEGSRRRAAICAARCQDLENVAVVCDAFQRFEPGSTFDVVTLIGVLEYSRQLGDGDDAPLDLLQRSSERLSDEGLLIVAIENQLGLKYLAGAPEDHFPQPFFGVNDLYDTRTPVTFGRVELQKLLTAAGLPHHEFFAPFPDYKLPVAVVHEDAYRDPRLDLATIIRSLPAAGQAFPYQRTFSEEMSWPVFIRNGLGLDVSNSFLVLVSGKSAAPLDGDRPSVWIYSTDRRRCFAKEKTIGDGPNGPRVRSHRIYNDPPPDGAYRQSLATDEPYLSGVLFATGFYRIVNQPGWTLESVAQWARPWVAWLASLKESDVRPDTIVPAAYLEAIPRNVFLTPSGRFVPFDLEWLAPADLPLPFVVWRGLLSAFRQAASVAPPDRSLMRYVRRHGIPHGDLNEIAAHTLALVGLAVSDDTLEAYRRSEFAFQRHVFGTALAKARRPSASQRISVRRGPADDFGLKDLTFMTAKRVRDKLSNR